MRRLGVRFPPPALLLRGYGAGRTNRRRPQARQSAGSLGGRGTVGAGRPDRLSLRRSMGPRSSDWLRLCAASHPVLSSSGPLEPESRPILSTSHPARSIRSPLGLRNVSWSRSYLHSQHKNLCVANLAPLADYFGHHACIPLSNNAAGRTAHATATGTCYTCGCR